MSVYFHSKPCEVCAAVLVDGTGDILPSVATLLCGSCSIPAMKLCHSLAIIVIAWHAPAEDGVPAEHAGNRQKKSGIYYSCFSV